MNQYKTLYIIGNGFDINLNIKSRYKDFQEYYATNKYKILKKLGIKPVVINGQKYAEYDFNPDSILFTDWNLTPLDFLYSANEGMFDVYGLEEKDDYWWSFESSLVDVDVFSIGQYYMSDNDTTVTYRYNKERLNDLRQNLTDSYKILEESIREWACQIKIPNFHKSIKDSDDSYFFTFNYTLTLEKVFDVNNDNIYHIHGSTTNPSTIKIGCDSPVEYMPTEFITGTYGVFENYFNKLKKNPKERMQYFKKHLKEHDSSLIDVNRIVVLGHSFNDVDWAYFIILRKMCRADAEWIVSTYTDDDKERCEELIKKLDISKSKVRFIDNIDEVVE